MVCVFLYTDSKMAVAALNSRHDDFSFFTGYEYLSKGGLQSLHPSFKSATTVFTVQNNFSLFVCAYNRTDEINTGHVTTKIKVYRSSSAIYTSHVLQFDMKCIVLQCEEGRIIIQRGKILKQ